jgi:hypothetical protein
MLCLRWTINEKINLPRSLNLNGDLNYEFKNKRKRNKKKIEKKRKGKRPSTRLGGLKSAHFPAPSAQPNVTLAPKTGTALLVSHLVLEGKPNANHVHARIRNSRTQRLHN